MKINVESIRDQAIAAVGGLVGGGLGALAGPEGMAVGGAAGSVGALLAAKTVPSYFSLDPVRRFLNNRNVSAILHKKIDEDLDSSFLWSQAELDGAISSMRDFLAAAAAHDSSISGLDKRMRRGFKWKLTTCAKDDGVFRACLRQLADFCQKRGPIRLATSAISAAVTAIFEDLNVRYAQNPGVRFDLSYDAINGRTLFESLLSKCDFHFAIGNLEALVLSDERNKLPLRIIGPIFGQKQGVYVSTRRRVGFRSGIWVFERASAQFQYHVGIGIPRTAQENKVFDARQIPDLVECIPPGDMVIAWSPLSSVLDRRRDFAIVPQSEFTNHFLLLGDKSVFRPELFPLDAFLTLFLSEWRHRSKHRRGLADRLRGNHNFMTAFALGAGHEWVPEI